MASSYTRRINLYINGKEVKNDIVSIKAEMSKLVNEQSRMTRGSLEYVAAGKKIRMLDGIIQQHREQIHSVSKSWNFNNIANSMNKYFLAVSTFVAGFSGILYSGKKAITMFAEFDDKVADVQKTTNLSRDSVYAMNEELKKVDTRTAQEELLDLGRIAGKLGIKAQEDVEGFIKASDKVVVALKEDLGGNAEEAVRQIGKLVTVFGVRDEFGIEESITKTGSAINELGMASTANEGYIVEFTKRVAGVAPTAKISIQNVMGLAATLDHLGQTSEVSSTAYSQVITGMFKDTPAYAKAAKMSVEDFTKLLNTDANGAFIKLLEGLNNNDAGMTELINSMGDLDMEGKRAISVIGVLSNNVGLLQEQQAISNREFEKGTSLQQEFNVKNNSAQAILEKKRKVLNNLAIELGQKLMPVLTASTSGFTYFVRAFSAITGFTIKHSGAILTLTASIGGYIIATKLATLWQNRHTAGTLLHTIALRANSIATGIAKGTTLLFAAAKALLTGNTLRATAAMKLFNLTIKASPIGLIIGVLTLAAGAIYGYIKSLNKLSVAQEALNAAKDRTVELMVEETAKISMLQALVDSETASLTTKKNAIDELKRIIPGYNAVLDETGRAVYNNTEAVKKYIEQLRRQYMLQAYQEEFGKASVEMAKAQEKYDTQTVKYNTVVKNAGDPSSWFDRALSGGLTERDLVVGSQQKELLDAKKALDEQKKAVKVLQSKVEASMNSVNKDLDSEITETAIMIINYNKAYNSETKKVNKDAIQAEIDKLVLKYNRLKKTKNGNANGTGGEFIPPSDPAGTKSKWSLNNDMQFLKQSWQLKKDYNAGVIKSQEELDAQLRELEVTFMKERILSGKEKGEELLDLQIQLEEKRIEIKKDSQKREASLQDEINKGMSPMQKENQEYEDRLIELRLYGKKREDMIAIELAALEALEREHNQKLSKLDADAMKDEINSRQRTYETQLTEMQLQHSNELNAITTLDQAKEILSSTMSNEELQNIRSLNKAKKLIQQRSALEEQEFTRQHLEELLNILQNVMGSGDWEGLSLSDKVLSEEEKQLLIDQINELKKLLAQLTAGTDETDPKTDMPKGMSTDILGFSQDDWEVLFQNLKDGNIGIGDLIKGVKALGVVWQAYYDFVAAGEQARLTEFERSVEKQKDTLQNNLDNNIISQEAYNYQVGQLDEQLDKKKAEFEYRNAVRNRNVALMNALVNTATAITAALTVAPPLGIILAGIVGAMGGLQVGAIMKTPLPELPGREQGGFLDVLRSQDGKQFRAKNSPGKRGYVSTPTVITGEKPGSSEYIVSDAGVTNPTVRPILDILEMARQNGNLATINLPAILESTRTYPGRQQGGYISHITGSTSGRNQRAAPAQDPTMLEIIRQNTLIIAAFKAELKKGIQSKVALHGRGGFYEAMDTDSQLKDNANI